MTLQRNPHSELWNNSQRNTKRSKSIQSSSSSFSFSFSGSRSASGKSIFLSSAPFPGSLGNPNRRHMWNRAVLVGIFRRMDGWMDVQSPDEETTTAIKSTTHSGQILLAFSPLSLRFHSFRALHFVRYVVRVWGEVEKGFNPTTGCGKLLTRMANTTKRRRREGSSPAADKESISAPPVSDQETTQR